MKKLSLMLLAGVLAFAVAGCSPSKSLAASEADMATARQIDEMLGQRLYKVDFSRATPMAGPSLALGHSYFISVLGDRVESFLPYFGRAYSLPFNGGEGLRFAAPISEYSDTVGKKGQREIAFKARTTEDVYEFTLTVYPLGESRLTILPTQKQSISFNGEMDLSPEFEARRKVE